MKKIQILTAVPYQKYFPQKVYDFLYNVEEKHFWFAGRNEVIKMIVDRFIGAKKGLRFLEIGCGNGIILALLEKLGFSLTGLDIDINALKLAQKRTNANLICADILKLDNRRRYDAVGLFDVLEHVSDDRSFLRKIRGMLKTRGNIILTVPSDMRLWSRMDEISEHKRRYVKDELVALLANTGYKIEFVSHFNFLLYIPQLLVRRFHDVKHKDKNDTCVYINELKIPPLIINVFLKWLFILEDQILRIITIPFGASLIIVGSKKD